MSFLLAIASSKGFNITSVKVVSVKMESFVSSLNNNSNNKFNREAVKQELLIYRLDKNNS